MGWDWGWIRGLGGEVVAGLAAHTGASTGAEHERFIALLEETRRRLGPRGMRGAWSDILEPPITSMADSQCWSASGAPRRGGRVRSADYGRMNE